MQGVLRANPVCIPEDRVSPLAGVCLAWGKQTNQESRFQPLAVAQVPNLLFGNQEAALQLLLRLPLWENFRRWALTVCLSYGTYQCLLWGEKEESPSQVAFKLARVTGSPSWQSSRRQCRKAELCAPKGALHPSPSWEVLPSGPTAGAEATRGQWLRGSHNQQAWRDGLCTSWQRRGCLCVAFLPWETIYY